jgi:Terminase large subunit, T4likevirus-type, N-terminal
MRAKRTYTKTEPIKAIKIPDYDPSPRQAKFHMSAAYETLYGGAAGGGKTAALCAEAVTCALEQDNTAVYIFRRTLKELSQSVYEEIMRQISPYQNLPDKKKQVRINYNGQESRFKFTNGSIIQLAYLDAVADRYRYQSAQIQVLLIDELTHFLEEDYDYLKTRVRPSSEGQRCRVMAATNPGGIGHAWVKEYFVEAGEAETLVKDVTGRTRQFIPAKVDDHPIESFRVSYRQTLQAIRDDNLREALLNGSWDSFQGQVFREWKPSKHVLTTGEFLNTVDLRECKKFVGFDWGWRDPAVATWIAMAPINEYGVRHLYAYREVHQTETTPEDWARQLQGIIDTEPVEWVAMPHDTYQHHLGNKTVSSVFTSPEFRLPVRPVQSLARGARMNRQATMHQVLSDSPDGTPYFQVHENCVNFIRTLPGLPYSDTIPEEIASKADDHCYDSASYALSLMRETGAFIIEPKRPNYGASVSWADMRVKTDPQEMQYDLSKLGGVLKEKKDNRSWQYR